MANLNRFITATLTTLSLFIGTIVYLSKPASADEVYIDNNCRRNQALPQDDRFTIFYSSQIRVNGQDYWFYAGRYQDGAAIFCISRVNFREASTAPGRSLRVRWRDRVIGWSAGGHLEA